MKFSSGTWNDYDAKVHFYKKGAKLEMPVARKFADFVPWDSWDKIKNFSWNGIFSFLLVKNGLYFIPLVNCTMHICQEVTLTLKLFISSNISFWIRINSPKNRNFWLINKKWGDYANKNNTYNIWTFFRVKLTSRQMCDAPSLDNRTFQLIHIGSSIVSA